LKIDIDDIVSAANLAGLAGEQRTLFMEKINMLAKEKEEDRLASKVPKRKNEHFIVIKGENVNPDLLQGAVFTMPEGSDPALLLDAIRAATVDQNIQKKNKKKANIQTFSDALTVKAKHQKERGYKGLTKEFCRIIAITPEQDKTFISTKIAKEEDFS
jgi:hypothetical protein